VKFDDIPTQLAKWFADEQSLLPLHTHGTPSLALLIDASRVRKLNADVRDILPDWPDDEWIIGEDGAGNYFVVSQSGSHTGVRQYDHEWQRFEEFMPNLRAFFDYFADIERRAKSGQASREG